MSAASLAIIWNPSKTTREDLEAGLAAAISGVDPQPEVTWYETSVEDPGKGMAQEALRAGAQVVVAAGGDGTVRAVAEALAEGEAGELGIVPLGTGNLLARNLDVPLNDIAGAFARVLDQETRQIDFGWVQADGPEGARHDGFAVMIGFGIDANMIAETDDDLKSKVGWVAYVESLGRAVASSAVIPFRVSIDGGEVDEVEAHTLMVGNCGMIQGGVMVMPDAAPDDGVLDAIILSGEGAIGWLDTMRSLVWDNGLRRLIRGGDAPAEDTDTAAFRSFTSMTVELTEPRVFQIDGEDIGEVTGLEISIQPGAIRVR